MNLYDAIAFDPEIHSIGNFSVQQDDGNAPVVTIVYYGPRRERRITLDATPLSADYLGLEFLLALKALPELGHVDFAKTRDIDWTRDGWNFACHAGSDRERFTWLREIGHLR